MQVATQTKDTHLIIMADETGIDTVFPWVKSALADTTFPMLSLLYYSPGHNFVFKRELDILEKHFPARFIVSYEEAGFDDHWYFVQESVEATINANTLPKMNFVISGNEAFTYKAKELLHFLGVNDILSLEDFIPQ